ncbi:MAG TPA: nitrogenase component 1 [Polyangiaceae bacterium]|nr:nitrogenase component 1 [Polyangiaceae bacterium]
MSDYIEQPRFSCALAGASTTVSALPRAIPVLHAAPGCAGNSTWTLLGGGGLQSGGYCATLSVPSSNVQESEVVFGGMDRLREQLKNTLKVMDGELFVVITGCVPAMIGDDAAAVVREFNGPKHTVLLAETGGFKGNSYVGYDQVLQTLFRDYLQPGLARDEKAVNLWGVPPSWDPFWRGNLASIRALLERIGLRVNSFFTHRDNLGRIRRASSASLNIVLSDVYGVEAAKLFESIHGTPYLCLPFPIGPTATAQFLTEVGQRAGVKAAKVRGAIASEEKRYFSHLQTLADVYSDMDLQRYAVVIGDANYGASLPRFLVQDLGWLCELVVHTDPLQEEQRKRLSERQALLSSDLRPKVLFETDTSKIQRHVTSLRPKNGSKYHDALSPAFVLGSSLDRSTAAAIGASHLSVSFPIANRAVLDRSYAGYDGGLRLTEDLLSAIVAAR